jgi:hypothetical protein
MIVVASGAAPFTGNVSMATPPTTGVFTKELIARGQTAMMRGAGGNGNAGKLTDVFLSVEAMEDIRAWGADQIDYITRREIINASDEQLSRIYGVVLHPMTEFGEGQEYQTYLTSTLSATQPTYTSEFAVGLDLATMDAFVQPVLQELETFEDPHLYREQRMGVYGHLEHGYAVLDARRAMLMAF